MYIIYLLLYDLRNNSMKKISSDINMKIWMAMHVLKYFIMYLSMLQCYQIPLTQALLILELYQ